MADEKPRTIIPRPSVVAEVAKWPPLTPTQKAVLRRAMDDWPAFIEARVRARHPELDAGDPAATHKQCGRCKAVKPIPEFAGDSYRCHACAATAGTAA